MCNPIWNKKDIEACTKDIIVDEDGIPCIVCSEGIIEEFTLDDFGDVFDEEEEDHE